MKPADGPCPRSGKTSSLQTANLWLERHQPERNQVVRSAEHRMLARKVPEGATPAGIMLEDGPGDAEYFAFSQFGFNSALRTFEPA